MAQVRGRSDLGEWVESYLEYLLREWEAVPEVAAEWDDWEEHERLDFVLEWPIREDRWLQLQHWAKDGLLTPAQCARYEALTVLMARHRPTIDRLLADEPPSTTSIDAIE
jgi:hypothetical protein